MGGKLNIHPKVAGGTLSGALALIILWAVSYALAVPAEVAAAFTLVCTTAGGYLAPVLRREQPAAVQEIEKLKVELAAAQGDVAAGQADVAEWRDIGRQVLEEGTPSAMAVGRIHAALGDGTAPPAPAPPPPDAAPPAPTA